ncbi:DUF2784 domain-containing protein [Adhaeribacter arboris]|uniref:DUF2784 domain-containing protein n=1 Tax=Adhaeribacter arboris TaxID=2072846 RepID=A0A2T2YC35_9BACT|nr:DUF2784 domain-containing protein [Adhaeribacter arboris]PSR53082.1 DUF2784 domain-containing protein [Adhaeribacter arboris]
MLTFLDVLFTGIHLLIICFNLFGWIWSATRKLHLICVGLTTFRWVVLGIWFGWGYCSITDYQWQIKEKLGEQNLPNSFIKYYADKLLHQDINALFMDTVTAVLFALAALISVYVNLRLRKLQT